MTTILAQTVAFPTDPLVATEILAVSTFIIAHPFFAPLFAPSDPSTTAVFAEINLKEPDKAFVQSYFLGPLQRKARALVYLIEVNRTYEVVVPLPDPPNIGAAPTTLSYKLIEDVMYPNNNKDLPPVDDPLGGTQCYSFFTRQDLIDAVLSTPALMARLAARNVVRSMLIDEYPAPGSGHPQIYPFSFYSFEAFRNFLGSRGCNCPDLVALDAPNHRFVPAAFFDQTIAPGGICIAPSNWGFLDGLYIIVDVTNRENPIYRIVEQCPVPKIGEPPIPVPVNDPYLPAVHCTLKQICTTMPDGVSFFVDDVNDVHFVSWDNWQFRWSYQRSGMSIYNVKYSDDFQGNDNVTQRRVLYKSAPTDTVVVYNVPEPLMARSFVSADSHNWPILHRLVPLVAGRDVPGYAKLYSVIRSDCTGNPVTVENAVAIYEQESDLLWRVNQDVIDFKNWPNGFDENGDPVGPAMTGARQRQLVIRTLYSGPNNMFVYSYVFNQDGSFETHCDLLGQTVNKWVEADSTGTVVPYGQRMSLQLVGLNHTYSCMFRMDWEIDGQNVNGSGNTVSEQNAFRNQNRGETSCNRKPSSGILRVDNSVNTAGCSKELGHCDTGMINICGQVVDVCELDFCTEKQAVRQHNMATNCIWSVSNPNSFNRLGFRRGFEVYSLSPNGNSVSLARDDSPAHTHMEYLKNHLHVTRYHAGEEYACGEFPVLSNKAVSPPGMSSYIANNECIKNTDVVMWLNAMFFKTPNTENYPFLSKRRLGFLFSPKNFLDQNPACSLEQSFESFDNGSCGQPESFVYNNCQ